MAKSNDGGPTFPVSHYVNADGETFESKPTGITLRDYLAAKAMQALLTTTQREDCWMSNIVRNSYKIASLMIEERPK